MKRQHQRLFDGDEQNPIILFAKWLYRLCRRISYTREFSIKEYAGLLFAAISAASAAIYIFAIALSVIATELSHAEINLISPSRVGPLGDSIGGLSAPLIGVVAAALSFLSFYMQYKANQGATKQFENTSFSEKRDRFDRRLEALIVQNREIAKGMTIFDSSSEKAFASLYKELKLSIETVRAESLETLTNGEIINIGYAFFYLGVGSTSNLLIRDLFREDTNIIDHLIFKFGWLQEEWAHNQEAMGLGASSSVGPLFEIQYLPFDGHQTRLGHYFRSYFHVLKFASTNGNGLFEFDQIYEKIKSLRTQTSTYEQILVLINSQTVFGFDLLDSGYVKDFKLTKNIPEPMIRFLGEIANPLERIDYDWFEIASRQASFKNAKTS